LRQFPFPWNVSRGKQHRSDISEIEAEIQDGWPRHSCAFFSFAELSRLYSLPFAVKIRELAISIGRLHNDLVPVAYSRVVVRERRPPSRFTRGTLSQCFAEEILFLEIKSRLAPFKGLRRTYKQRGRASIMPCY